MTLIVFSFAVVVLGYTLISHAFDLFLYPDPEFRKLIYAAADIDLVTCTDDLDEVMDLWNDRGDRCV